MINLETNCVIVPTIDCLWREAMSLCIQKGEDFLVKGGSYVGQIRKQLPYFTGVVTAPWSTPFAPITPPGIPPPTSEEKIEKYFQRYIVGREKEPNEIYTYGEFILQQIDQIIVLLNDSKGNTNQATICIGDVSTTFLSDPPCLRSISFKVVNGKFQMCVYFRSWDLYAGLPENLGGLQMLKEYVWSHMEFQVDDGPIIAFSDGLHLYEQYFSIVDCLNVDKIQVSEEAMADKDEFIGVHGV